MNLSNIKCGCKGDEMNGRTWALFHAQHAIQIYTTVGLIMKWMMMMMTTTPKIQMSFRHIDKLIWIKPSMGSALSTKTRKSQILGGRNGPNPKVNIRQQTPISHWVRLTNNHHSAKRFPFNLNISRTHNYKRQDRRHYAWGYRNSHCVFCMPSCSYTSFM